jgi:hypothetical protein
MVARGRCRGERGSAAAASDGGHAAARMAAALVYPRGQRARAHTDPKPSTAHGMHAPSAPAARDSQPRETTGCGSTAHRTATCAGERPHLLTPIATTPATPHDAQGTETMQHAIEQNHLLPAAPLLARGDGAPPVLIASEPNHGLAVMGPIKGETPWQAQAGHGFALTGVPMAWDTQRVTCPGGPMRHVGADSRDNAGHPRLSVRFAKASGQACPVRTLVPARSKDRGHGAANPAASMSGGRGLATENSPTSAKSARRQTGRHGRHDVPGHTRLRCTTCAGEGTSDTPSPASLERAGDAPRSLCRLEQRRTALYHAHIDLRSAGYRPNMISPTVSFGVELPCGATPGMIWGHFTWFLSRRIIRSGEGHDPARRNGRSCPGWSTVSVVLSPTAGSTRLGRHASARIVGRGCSRRAMPSVFGRRMAPSPTTADHDGIGCPRQRTAKRCGTASRAGRTSRVANGRPQRRVGRNRVRKVPAVAW